MIQKIQEIKIEEFNYPLLDEKIAKFPLPERDQSKLLLYKDGEISEKVFTDISTFLPSNSLMIFNNTRVIQARLYFYKETGAKIEIFCLEPLKPNDYLLSFQSKKSCTWLCMIGNLKKLKEGELSLQVIINGKRVVFSAKRIQTIGNAHEVEFSWTNEDISFADFLTAVGELPIPPYLNRPTEEKDKDTYQTVYSKIEGSVAAPTAGLHFSERVFADIKAKGIKCEELTLHVGAGTFQPVKSETIEGHEMHTEFISVDRELINKLAEGDSIIAVGTTSVRTLESLYYIGCHLLDNLNATEEGLKVKQWQPYQKEYLVDKKTALRAIVNYLMQKGSDKLVTSTQIMIAPGYQFRIVNGIVTNFHQPSSTLLLLVSAFVDGNWKQIYDYALSHNFRFLSYGDSSLLLR